MDSKKAATNSIRLQTRLILYTTAIVIVVMVLVMILVEQGQRGTIQEEARKRGTAIARNLAAVSTNALLTYNYIVLEQHAEKVALEEDIAYAIIHDKENQVAAYSRHDERQGMILKDEVSQRAVTAKETLIQKVSHGEKRIPVLDISIPVYIKESPEKWGTIRIGLSLERMHGQIEKTRLNLFLLTLLAIGLGILGSIFFSRRITKPISRLVATSLSAAQGNLEQVIDIRTGDEIEELGENFNYMMEQIRLHRNELEKRLHEITSLKGYTDNILSSMTNGLMTIDLEERVVTVNEMAERILGRKTEEMTGLPFRQIFGEGYPLYGMMLETLSQGKGISYSEMELKRGEDAVWLTASTSVLYGDKEEKIGAMAVLQDITEIKNLEEKLRQADRLAALGTLSAGLAHEIRNPLSAIKTFVQLLPKKFESPSFMEKFNVTVPREIDRINLLVEDLLELTRRRKRPFVNLNLNQLVLQVIDLHGEEMRKRSIVFENRLDGTLPLIDADSERLYRAFSNLVINSVQAMPNGGSLTISSEFEPSASVVKILFKDTGIGMDEVTSRNLFNPFFTTKDKGVGLGMAITRKTIEDHRGTIEATSEKGKGTTFILCLPVVKT